jgi:hypothetical protein
MIALSNLSRRAECGLRPPRRDASQPLLPPLQGKAIKESFQSPWRGNHNREGLQAPHQGGAEYPTSVTIRYPYLLLLTLPKTRENKEKKGKKREKKGSNRCNRCNRCLKSFAEKTPKKTFIFTPPDLLHSLQSVTFSGAAPIVCSNQSDRTLSFHSVNFCRKLIISHGPSSVNCINDRNALP